MPSYPAYRPPAPYQPSNMTDLIMHRGQIEADAARNSGNIWGNAFANIGTTIAGGIQQNAEENQRKKQSIAFEAALQSGDPRAIISVLGPERGPAVITALSAHAPDGMKRYTDRMQLGRDQARGILAVPEDMRPQAYAFARNSLLSAGAFKPEELPEDFAQAMPIISQVANYGMEPGKAKAPIIAKPGDVVLDPETYAQRAAIPVAEKPAEPRVVGRSLVGPDGRVIYRDPAEPRADNEPLMAVIGDDGKPVYMPRSRAVGRTPASNREQGRPVTSGDAGRVADLDTSLDDLGKLRATVTGNGATGTSARVGAALPNFVTEATGIGTEAKQKQATIDRVKQVIGKALEGGVLRKEDEYKYEKILPTIGDTPAVVESKLQGLEQAIALRRQRTLESLSDAGYDTARFESRAPGASPASGLSGGGPVRVSSPAEAARLPKGTMFQTPDGRIMRVP